MKVQELIGKLAIRTKPTSNGDYSFTRYPVHILDVKQIGIKWVDCIFIEFLDIGVKGNINVLDSNYLDDNWKEYEGDREKLNLEGTLYEAREKAFHADFMDGIQEIMQSKLEYLRNENKKLNTQLRYLNQVTKIGPGYIQIDKEEYDNMKKYIEVLSEENKELRERLITAYAKEINNDI